MYTCERCGKPTPNYREYSPALAAIVGVQGRSWCDECRRELRIVHEWENEQEADERMICPYCEGEQGDYNRYIVNDRVYGRFEDIALAYSR